MFVLKFDPSGGIVWQRLWDDAAGFEAIAVTSDGSVYAASSRLRPNSNFSQFDEMVLKLTPAGDLVWARTYGAGEVVDARGGMAAAADGSIYTAGAIQAAKGGIIGINALVLKIGSDGSLLFGKDCCTKGGDTGDGIAVAPDGSVLLAGTTTSLGVGSQDAFVARLQSTGKKVTAAATWGGTGFDSGGGVAAAADNEPRPTVFAAGGVAETVRAEIHSRDPCGRAHGCARHGFESAAWGVRAGRQHDLLRKLRGGTHRPPAAVTASVGWLYSSEIPTLPVRGMLGLSAWA